MKIVIEKEQLYPSSTNTKEPMYKITVKGEGTKEECDYVIQLLTVK